MAHLVSLDNVAHRQLRVDQRRAEAAGAALNMVPVVLSEFLKLVIQYPIALTKDRDTGRFSCVALFGFHDQENLFVDQGEWQGIYVPLQVARQPFFLGQGSDEGQFLMCIDTEHPGIVQEGGEALFNADGSETAYLDNIKQNLAELLNGEEPTRHFVDTLASMKLLTPMQLEITFENGQSTQVQGLYTIDEARLDALSPEDLASLHAQRLLGPVYTMLASLGHIYGMIARRNLLDQHASQRA